MLRTDLIRPLLELLRENAFRHADRIAFADGRRSVTYAQLELRTRRVAGHLADLRLQPGDRAMICLGNRVETVESYYAVLRASALAVPVDPRSADAELAYLLDNCGARLVITDHAHVERFLRLSAGSDLRIVLVGDEPPVPGCVSWEALLARKPRAAARDDLGLDEPAWVLYTSGTTGRPKGVVSTQRSCLWSVAACYVPVAGLGPDDRVLWPLPLFHSLSHIVCVLGVVAVGASARLLPGFAADDVLGAVAEFRPTVLAGVPTAYHHLVSVGGGDLSGVRVGLVGGAVLPAGLRRSFEDIFGVPLVDAYGSTEACGAIAVNWVSGGRVAGSCGLPVLGLAVRLVGVGSGSDVGVGCEGEVWVRGPNVMLGYYNQPAATAEVLVDGWLRTGDLARRDESGFLTITGRIKELIIRAGENVHPAEVEDVVRGVAGVADVAVVGRPHEVLGEVPVVFVVPGPEGFDPADVLAACHERLSPFKVPEAVYQITRLPRTASGKIKRHALLDLPARLRAIGDDEYESLLRMDWVPRPLLLDPPALTGSWAVAGPGGDALAAGLRLAASPDRAGPDIRVGTSPGELRAAIVGRAPDLLVLLPAAGGAAEDVGDAVEAGVRALTAEVAAWLADERQSASTVVVLTRGAVVTSDQEDVRELRHAPIWGAVRSLQAEHPSRVRLVDVDAGSCPWTAALIRAVLAGETQSAVRGGVVLVPRLARVSAPAEPGRGPAVDPAGTVLVAGADGPRGAAIARHLATAHGVRHLLLLSADGWPDAVAAELTARFAAVGTEITLGTGTAADRPALATLLDGGKRAVTGVVHAEETSTRYPVGAAIRGLVNLHELTRRDELGLFVLVTSACGPLGGAGRAEQAAVDAFGEALVLRRRRRGLPGLALAWGPLAEEGRSRFPGAGPMSTSDGLAMVDAALAAGQGSLCVLRVDPANVRARPVPDHASVVLHDLIDLAPANPTAGDRRVTPRQEEESDGAYVAR
ncbi:AMP-binding protein [Amycolatopsis sp. WQ 127309]|uniref:AMP-binding protein n=1 Tax=Amycolatopsis sp. WQ 127309 TaxID=2932773 RepID=UPI001FF4EF96|nr:AMP-binding protein [Amycolatopsis sp. WQ 127309]UOZ02746.1 AMP-binding protein [Amycolatopsis sp. WQ 127309]